MSSAQDKLRVVQWATGKVGARSMKAIIEHPALELVGLYVHSASKEGKDAGELCGLSPVGITATRSINDIVALNPDCVIYMQEGVNIDDLCRLLEAGINVVTTRGEFFFPPKMDQQLRERTEAACKKGRSSLHATGSSPGFITEAIPVVLTSVARRVDCVTIDEFAYIPESCSPEMVFDVMGYGRAPTDEFDPGMLHHMAQCFDQSLSSTAAALGLAIDEVKSFGETAVASSRVKIAEGAYIEPGTVAAQRITIAAMRKGKPVIQLRTNWYCATDLDKDWHLAETGWRVVVEGDTPLDVRLTMPRTDEPVAEQMGGYTAHRAVNAIHAVCAAAPGIRTTAELPQIVAHLGYA